MIKYYHSGVDWAAEKNFSTAQNHLGTQPPTPPIPALGRKIPNLTTTRLGPSLQVLPLFPRQQPLTTTTESTGSCLQAEVLLPLQQTTTTTTERTGSCLQAKHQASKQASREQATTAERAGWCLQAWHSFPANELATTTQRSGPCLQL